MNSPGFASPRRFSDFQRRKSRSGPRRNLIQGDGRLLLRRIPGHRPGWRSNRCENASRRERGWPAITGNVSVSGTLTASGKDFKIDHPLDPANKYPVQSSERMNIYSGNVTTDELGLATVTLPDWFEAENTDFRYQLTTIGRDAHAWVAAEVSKKQFKIATNASHVKVA